MFIRRFLVPAFFMATPMLQSAFLQALDNLLLLHGLNPFGPFQLQKSSRLFKLLPHLRRPCPQRSNKVFPPLKLIARSAFHLGNFFLSGLDVLVDGLSAILERADLPLRVPQARFGGRDKGGADL
jgi:hypothetical protein